MSVINKMLRDLDKRQAVEQANQGASGMRSLRRGTSSVGGFGAAERPRATQAARWGGALALALAVAAAGLWWMQSAPVGRLLPTPTERAAAPLAAPDVPQAAAPVAPVASAAPAVPQAAPAASAALLPGVAAAVPAPAALAPGMPSTPAAPLAPVVALAPTVAPASKAPPRIPPATTPAGSDAATPATPALAAARSTASVAAIDPVLLAQAQQQAGREALAHAQTLWANGSRDLAIDLLQQAQTAAERASQTSPMASNTQHLAAVVRELARMLLAQGRAAAALDLLVRVEAPLAGEADIWAMRANVAQRLGRHQDSVQAYTVALQSRPTEPRWLLGAAVSLAALGQTAPATEMAQRARLAGPISKEVQSYLRQMGVNLPE